MEARWWGCDPILLANFNRIHGSHTFTTFHNGSAWYKFMNQCLLVAFCMPHVNLPSVYGLYVVHKPFATLMQVTTGIKEFDLI